MNRYLYYVFIFYFFSCYLQAQVRINEILSSNLSYANDSYGDYDDFIELYNPTNEIIDLAGYYLSDDFNYLTKWIFPQDDSLFIIFPNEYIILWADNEPSQGSEHLSFSLNKDGESVILTDIDGSTIIDQKDYGTQIADISFGRSSSENNVWLYFTSPTLGAQNSSVGFEGIIDIPNIYPEGGYIYEPSIVSIINNNSEELIYYTLDGDYPTPYAVLYEDQFIVSNTTIVNARAFRDNHVPSFSNSFIYLMNESYSLPILSVMTDPINLWDDSFGIYTNYLEEGINWERRCNNQYFTNNLPLFYTSSGIRIQGRSSRVRPKKSFRLFYKNAYEQDRLIYPLFGMNGPTSFKNLVLRSGYDDDIQMPTGTLIRDPLVSEIWQKLGMLTSRSKFCNLIINEHFISDHTGYFDFDLIRYLKDSIEVKFGTIDEWSVLNSFIRETDFTIMDNYQEALNRIDMENFLNLQALIICAEYRSWGWGVSAYRNKNPSAKWKWTIWDMDRAFTNSNWNGFVFLNDTTGYEKPNTFAFRLLKNEQFKFDYINRISDFLNTIFKPENLIAEIDSLKNILDDDIVYEANRWGVDTSNWEQNIQTLRLFAINRSDIVKQQILDYLVMVQL